MKSENDPFRFFQIAAGVYRAQAVAKLHDVKHSALHRGEPSQRLVIVVSCEMGPGPKKVTVREPATEPTKNVPDDAGTTPY